VHFAIEQRIEGLPGAVASVFVDEGFYVSLDALPKLGRPEVLSREVHDTIVHMRVRYRFTGELSSAVRAVVDPHKLTWVEETDHDLAARNVSFRMIADHYADRFRADGHYRFEPSGATATIRRCEGDLEVRMRLVGHRVEQAIVSGLREHLNTEVDFVEAWLGAR
jgi:hypothetical protein